MIFITALVLFIVQLFKYSSGIIFIGFRHNIIHQQSIYKYLVFPEGEEICLKIYIMTSSIVQLLHCQWNQAGTCDWHSFVVHYSVSNSKNLNLSYPGLEL